MAYRERRDSQKPSKRWYENNKERIVRRQRAYVQENNEHVNNYQRQYCKNNRERLNGYWRGYYATNKEGITQRLREQRQRKIGQNIVRFGAWDQGSEKLETSLVPSEHAVTLCGIPKAKA